ncbi:MAG: exodeoxyribonuclease VII small subunit [Woeseiaceae bacterium]|jgi:exodeoxyribonuclease VII small subunit|nr:exodeoxyribonuclease VII small subunit [Woeseiaceae bacterium]|tara:strand:- start:663 stop:905 length:243 start_codon:yes stop_codon:yes gene_type:complete
MTDKKNINLEKSLADLEALVAELEGGELSLEDAMKKFEQGIKLTRTCQNILKDAEQKVEILLENNGEDTLTSFNDKTNGD